MAKRGYGKKTSVWSRARATEPIIVLKKLRCGMANYGKDWWCLYRANVGDVKKRCLGPDRLTREKKVEQNLRSCNNRGKGRIRETAVRVGHVRRGSVARGRFRTCVLFFAVPDLGSRGNCARNKLLLGASHRRKASTRRPVRRRRGTSVAEDNRSGAGSGLAIFAALWEARAMEARSIWG